MDLSDSIRGELPTLPPAAPVGEKRKWVETSMGKVSRLSGRIPIDQLASSPVDLLQEEVEDLKRQFSALQLESATADTLSGFLDFAQWNKRKIECLQSLSPITSSWTKGPEKKKKKEDIEAVQREASLLFQQMKSQVEALADKVVQTGGGDVKCLEIGKRALEWLAGLDPRTAIGPLFRVAELVLPNFDDTMAILKKMSPLLPPSLQKEVVRIGQAKDVEGLKPLVERIRILATAIRMMPLLEKAISEHEKKGAPLTTEEKADLDSFLRASMGNMDLNEWLRSKVAPTDVEEFLIGFTFCTTDFDAKEARVMAVQTVLENMGLLELFAAYRDVRRSEKQVCDALGECVKILDDCGMKEQEHVQLLLDKLSPPFRSKWHEFRTEAYKDLLRQIGRELPEIGSRIPPGEEQERFDECIHGVVDLLQKRLELIEAIDRDIKRYEEQASDPKREPPLHVSDFRDMMMLTKVNRYLTRLCHESYDLEDTPWKDLYDRTDLAAAQEEWLSSFVSGLPGYLPGDVLLEDERLLKTYEGRGAPVFSQLSLRSHPLQTTATLWRAFRSKGVFAVQPYFTGGRIHASLIRAEDGDLKTCEVPLKYTGIEPTVLNSLLTVVYRPDFLCQLTDEGKRALKALWGDLSDDQLREHLRNIYSECLSTFVTEPRQKGIIESHEEVSSSTAAMAFFLDAMQKAPTPLQQLTELVASRVLKKPVEPSVSAAIERPRRLLKAKRRLPSSSPQPSTLRTYSVPTPSDLELREKMFCSEFVSRVITAAEDRMNQRLQALRQEQEPGAPPIQFLKPAIPSGIPRESIHPNKLEAILQSQYRRADVPLITKLLVGDLL